MGGGVGGNGVEKYFRLFVTVTSEDACCSMQNVKKPCVVHVLCLLPLLLFYFHSAFAIN